MASIEAVVARILARQDPTRRHTWLTRIVVSAIIVVSNCILYGFYGVMGSVVMYLLGVELGGLGLEWMYLPLGMMLALGLWMSFRSLIDYWRNYGHG